MWIRMCYGVVDLKKTALVWTLLQIHEPDYWVKLLSQNKIPKQLNSFSLLQAQWIMQGASFSTEPPLDSFNLIIIEWCTLIPCPVVPFPEYDISLSWLSRYGTATINIYRWENFLRKSLSELHYFDPTSQLPQDCHIPLCLNSYGT